MYQFDYLRIIVKRKIVQNERKKKNMKETEIDRTNASEQVTKEI